MCAGVADQVNFRTGTVRLIAIISLVLFFGPAALIYIGATMPLKEKPLIYSGRHREYEFWKRYSQDDSWGRP